MARRQHSRQLLTKRGTVRRNNQERLGFTMELRGANIDHVYIAARASLAGNSFFNRSICNTMPKIADTHFYTFSTQSFQDAFCPCLHESIPIS